MITRNLNIRELARILPISKQWNDIVHGSKELRRTLFLSPVRERTYLERSVSGVETIVRQHSKGSYWLVEPHPILQQFWSKFGRATYNNIDWMPCSLLATVPPETLLFQLPVVKIFVTHRLREMSILRMSGVTFGAVVDALEAMRDEDEKNLAKNPKYRIGGLAVVGDRCTYLKFEARGTIWKAGKDIEDARAEQYLARFRH
jgi:hypothetical protein